MGEQECQLLGGAFANFMQFSLGAICVLILIYKRQTEVPRRDWLIWFLDVTKQALGSFIGHFANVFASIIIANSIVNADECLWYCLTHVVGSTFGTAIKLFFLYALEKIVQKYQIGIEYLNFGEYGDPPSMKIFYIQLAIWILFVVLSKAITLVLMAQILIPLDQAMSYAFQIFKNHPDLELVMVMIIIPTILNIVIFWVTDNFLKKQDLHLPTATVGLVTTSKYKQDN